jgi:hypothetical protein
MFKKNKSPAKVYKTGWAESNYSEILSSKNVFFLIPPEEDVFSPGEKSRNRR